jgi:SAM-dependent MidA family methyltransferase
LNDLPKLSALEQEHSQRLIHVLQQKIIEAGGKIPFSAFMEACLYAPGLGYYSAGATKFGQSGDFVTAPEISILFGQCLAEYFYKVKKQNFADQPLSIIELGAGTGKLAGDLLTHLKKLDALPAHYYILEVSADLKEKQQIYLKNTLPIYRNNITWLDSIESLPNFNGNALILANEVLDALPVELFSLTPKKPAGFELYQEWITLNPDASRPFERLSLPADENFQKAFNSSLNLSSFSFETPTYLSEINLNLFSWLSGIEKIIQKGQILFIDYGFGSKEYYHPTRHMGTLMCHYKHRAHTDFLANIGLQDITAHVNFTQVATGAKQLNLTIDNFTTQAEFLLSQNFTRLVEQKLLKAAPAQKIGITNEIQLLTAPHEMGELCKVLILQKGDLHSIASGRPHFHRL